MIPTTLGGVLLLLFFLLPGFVYVVLRERHRPIRKVSVFRETSAVLSASTAAYLLPLLISVVVLLASTDARKAVREYLAAPGAYRDGHPLGVTGTAVAFVVAGIACAFVLAAPWFPGTKKADPAGSAWWTIFSKALTPAQTHPRITVTLDDDTVVIGNLYSWSRDAEDSPDRDLLMQPPLWIQYAGTDKVVDLSAGVFAVSARHIRYLSVDYIPLTAISASTESDE